MQPGKCTTHDNRIAKGYGMAMHEKKSIWVLQGARVGDNAQAMALAQLVDGEVKAITLKFNVLHHLPNVALGASVASLTGQSRAQLRAPWPDLVIATGKRMAPVVLWIKYKSGGHTKAVHLGRPRARLSEFDVVIATRQYGLPSDRNVITLDLPFSNAQKAGVEELQRWRELWHELPKPWIAVAVGSAKYPLRFGTSEVPTLAAALNDLARQIKGSLLLIASPRTKPSLVDTLGTLLTVPHLSYGVFDSANNPYRAALALCDRFVVTSDSVSMISDLLTNGKPVAVFKLPESKLRVRWSARAGLAAWLSRNGYLQPPRDVPRLVERLIESGSIGVLGTAFQPTQQRPAHEEIIARLNQLLKT
jgi:uncharacterized protein